MKPRPGRAFGTSKALSEVIREPCCLHMSGHTHGISWDEYHWDEHHENTVAPNNALCPLRMVHSAHRMPARAGGRTAASAAESHREPAGAPGGGRMGRIYRSA